MSYGGETRSRVLTWGEFSCCCCFFLKDWCTYILMCYRNALYLLNCKLLFRLAIVRLLGCYEFNPNVTCVRTENPRQLTRACHFATKLTFAMFSELIPCYWRWAAAQDNFYPITIDFSVRAQEIRFWKYCGKPKNEFPIPLSYFVSNRFALMR